jgi:death-on-curing protein
MSEPVWVMRSVIDAMHDMQLAEHGGASDVRDEGLLESALARPQNLHVYGESNLCALAAAYAFGLARDHPYVDGNKRTAFLAAYVFLKINGISLTATEIDATAAMLNLASGTIDAGSFAVWLRANTQDAS